MDVGYLICAGWDGDDVWRCGSARFVRGKAHLHPASVWRAQFHPFIYPRPPPRCLRSPHHLYAFHTRRGRTDQRNLPPLLYAHLPSTRIPPLFPPLSPPMPRHPVPFASYQPATTRAFAIVWLLCRCYRGVSVRLYKGDSFSGKYQFLRRMNFDSRERVKRAVRGEGFLCLLSSFSLSLSLSLSLSPRFVKRELSLPWTFLQTNI